MVYVEYRGELAGLTGVPGEEIEAAKVKDVLRHIKNAYGAEAHRHAKKMLVVVDRKSVTLLQNFNTPLHDGARVGFLPICGGG